MAAFRRREPAPSIERIGSARRAWVSVRNATVIFAPLWVISLLLGPTSKNGDWADLTWVAIGSIFYVVALVVVLPLFAFTLGRWIDKRTWRSTRKAVLTFGYYGLAWGVVAVGIYGFGGNPSLGLLLWLADSRHRRGSGAPAARCSQPHLDRHLMGAVRGGSSAGDLRDRDPTDWRV